MDIYSTFTTKRIDQVTKEEKVQMNVEFIENQIKQQTLPSLSSSVHIRPFCSKCRNNYNIWACMQCNHNYCLECLVYICIQQISEFLDRFNENQELIRNNFSYQCGIQDCGTVIYVPTAMVLYFLKYFASYTENIVNKTYIEMFCERNIYMQGIDTLYWIPFFDGIIFADIFNSIQKTSI